jgi:hypothetical protein
MAIECLPQPRLLHFKLGKFDPMMGLDVLVSVAMECPLEGIDDVAA